GGGRRGRHSFPTRRSSDLVFDHGVEENRSPASPMRSGRGAVEILTRKRRGLEVAEAGVGIARVEGVGVAVDDERLQHRHGDREVDRKSTRLNSSHVKISYA